MNRLTSALAVAAFAFAALPVLAADPTAPMVFALTAQNGSGEIGTVVLTPMGDKTKVDVAIVGAPAGVIQPDHIHTGTCAKLDPKPAYGLAALTNGVSSTVVPVSMATLLASPFAVNVHKSATEIATYVSCGNLAASMPGMKM
jgi:hypothetical protein